MSRNSSISLGLGALEDIIAKGRELMQAAHDGNANLAQARVELDTMGKVTKAVAAHTNLRLNAPRILEAEARIVNAVHQEDKKLTAPTEPGKNPKES